MGFHRLYVSVLDASGLGKPDASACAQSDWQLPPSRLGGFQLANLPFQFGERLLKHVPVAGMSG